MSIEAFAPKGDYILVQYIDGYLIDRSAAELVENRIAIFGSRKFGTSIGSDEHLKTDTVVGFENGFGGSVNGMPLLTDEVYPSRNGNLYRGA